MVTRGAGALVGRRDAGTAERNAYTSLSPASSATSAVLNKLISMLISSQSEPR